MASAWGSSWASAWGGSWGSVGGSPPPPPPPAPAPEAGGGGGSWGHWKRAPYEPIRWRKKAPPAVVKAVEKTAKKYLKRAIYRAEREVEPPPQIQAQQDAPQKLDVQQWLDAMQAERVRAIKNELKRSRIEWRAIYAQAVEQEIALMRAKVEREAAEQEDDDIRALMFAFQRFFH